MNEEEKTFLNTEAAKVTSARVVIGNQTFAMAGITSVEVKREDHKISSVPFLLVIMLGLGAFPTSTIAGFVILGGGLIAWFNEARTPPSFNLVIRAAGGEINALKSSNATVVETIASAITDAMVYRG